MRNVAEFEPNVRIDGGHYVLELNGISSTCDFNELDEELECFPEFYYQQRKKLLKRKLINHLALHEGV